MASAGTEKRIRAELHRRYIARLDSLVPPTLPGADRRAALETATRAASPEGDTDGAIERLAGIGLAPGPAADLVAAARDIGPDLDRTVDVEDRSARRAERAFLPRVVGGIVLGIVAIGGMAAWEDLGMPPGGVYFAILPQRLAAGLILYGLFDRQSRREGARFAREIREEYRERRASSAQ